MPIRRTPPPSSPGACLSRRLNAAWRSLALVGGVLLALPGTVAAQSPRPATAAPTAGAPAPNPAASPGSAAEPEVHRQVVEDDLARVEELRVRGQVTRVVVRSKVLNARPYEVAVGEAGRDPSQRGRSSGQPMWHLFAF